MLTGNPNNIVEGLGSVVAHVGVVVGQARDDGTNDVTHVRAAVLRWGGVGRECVAGVGG